VRQCGLSTGENSRTGSFVEQDMPHPRNGSRKGPSQGPVRGQGSIRDQGSVRGQGSIRSGIHGQVRRWAGQPRRIAATDAGWSWKRASGGMGYLVSDGHWGIRGWRTSRLDPTGHSKVLVTELRAIEFMLTRLTSEPLTVLVDSTSALHHLRQWQQGAVDVMPAGYDLRPRHGGRKPTLVRLAVRVADRPDLTFRHVKGHSGHLLNEAADSLARIARRRTLSKFDAAARAQDLAASFLTSWHAEAQRAEHPRGGA
jgi:ribonuclease HI